MTTEYDAVVVGAGFGGMGAAIQLKRLGHDNLLVLERETDLGGTWHVNRYPGLAVDIPSSTYSYSFEPNPYWSRLFAPGAELKAYAEHVADRYDLRRHMRFGVVVTGARWEDDHWAVSCADGTRVTARYLLTATGFLSQPKMPDIDGIDTFAGKVIHTADWDESYDLTGKRAAVIGTGATAVQLIPEVAKAVAELTVYQRTPIWVSPKPDLTVPAALQRTFAMLPVTQRLVRLLGTSVLEVMMVLGVLRFRAFPLANRLGERWCRAHLLRQVRDPELRRKLTPGYSFGCKRPTFSNDYYPTLTREHVHLETTSIERVDATGIVTADGNRRDIDVLLLATGFDLWDVNFQALEIIGRNGRDLGAWWRARRFQAYEGVTVPAFPNLISLNSPYSYSGLSYFTTIETQMRHIDRLFTAMRQRGATVFEVTQDANDRFLDRMTTRIGDSVFVLGRCATANSYYFNPHGEATLLRPTTTRDAYREASRFPVDDYTYA
jgi:cation diffusion facilitator CzcD-associated flavoprotein CzcO